MKHEAIGSWRMVSENWNKKEKIKYRKNLETIESGDYSNSPCIKRKMLGYNTDLSKEYKIKKIKGQRKFVYIGNTNILPILK